MNDSQLNHGMDNDAHIDDCRCRTCGGTNTRLLGQLPDSSDFAGQLTAIPLPGGSLWRCFTCGFVYRAPLLPDSTYNSLYATGSVNLWDTESIPREDFRLIRNLISNFDTQPLKVLDVGCYTGKLLKMLPESYDLYGIEPNQLAAKVASERGIKMLTAEELGSASRQKTFDVIVLCDVIEHVAKPKELLESLRKSLKTGGFLIVSTGNSDAWLWRLTKAKFWYCHFPEHISFIGKRWLSEIPESIRLKVRRQLFFNYRGKGTNPVKLGAALIYWLSPTFYRILRQATAVSRSPKPTPGIGATKDHLICVLEAT